MGENFVVVQQGSSPGALYSSFAKIDKKSGMNLVLTIFDVDLFTVSRGMVNLMAGIDKVKIWANFTYNKETGKVLGEFRSRDIVIVDIAKKYGGGGHACACGATIDSFDVAYEVLKDFDRLLEENENA